MRRAFRPLLNASPRETCARVDAAAKRLADIVPGREAVVDDGRAYLYALMWWDAADGVGTGEAYHARMMDWTRRTTGREPLEWYAARLTVARMILFDLGAAMHDAIVATRIIESNFD